MRIVASISGSLLGGILSACFAVPVVAQSSRIPAQDCLGSMHGDTCEMTAEQYDVYTRNRDWNDNVKRNAEYAAEQRQLSAQAKARYNQRTLTGASAVMRRRREAAEANGK